MFSWGSQSLPPLQAIYARSFSCPWDWFNSMASGDRDRDGMTPPSAKREISSVSGLARRIVVDTVLYWSLAYTAIAERSNLLTATVVALKQWRTGNGILVSNFIKNCCDYYIVNSEKGQIYKNYKNRCGHWCLVHTVRVQAEDWQRNFLTRCLGLWAPLRCEIFYIVVRIMSL